MLHAWLWKAKRSCVNAICEEMQARYECTSVNGYSLRIVHTHTCTFIAASSDWRSCSATFDFKVEVKGNATVKD